MRIDPAGLVCLLVVATLTVSAGIANRLHAIDSPGYRRSPRDGLAYVRIPAGEFVMGCVDRDVHCQAAERPRHRVRLRQPVWIGATEVTVGAFRRFTKATRFRTRAEVEHRGRAWVQLRNQWDWISGLTWATPLKPAQNAPDTWPALQVAWSDARAYCDWAGGRLPSEAEWERAARGGRDDEIFPWGNAERPQDRSIHYANGPDEVTHGVFPSWTFFSGYRDGYADVAPVGQFAANGFGLYDMAGNAWEWVADWYAENYYAHSPTVDPSGPTTGAAHVVRGGSWSYAPEQHRSSERGFAETGFWTATFGFRCAIDDWPER
jgi:formylglycine-generating enzyme required for sulfatase activity